MELAVNALYKIKNAGVADPNNNKIVVIMSITGTPSISYGFYTNEETQPASLSELAADFPADTTLTAGDWVSTEISNYDYIGFSGTGTVRIKNLELSLVDGGGS